MKKRCSFGWTTTAQLMFIALFCLTSPQQPGAQGVQGVLDNPQPNSVQSGIGLINGWVCDAEEVLIQIDELPPLPAAYGTTRADTLDACGDDDNGFGLTFNWNLVGEGLHRLRVTADGSEVAAVAFVVATLGLGEFPQGLAGEGRVEDFPLPGNVVEVEWQESLQNFVLTGTEGVGEGGSGGGPSRVLENPQPGSFQSGVGLISGFVCEANVVSIQIDDFPAAPAAYGTTRGDTVRVCGDDDNGFGLTFNWNIVGNGAHRVRAFAEGEQFADVRVTVTTVELGEFPRLEDFPTSVASVDDFPQAGSSVSIQWQDSKQNFIVEGIIGQNARCDSPEGEAFDSSGVRGIFRLLNLCSLDGGTARIDVETPVQIPPQEGQLVMQTQAEGFEFCAADLRFLQGATELLPGDFRIVDGRGDEIVCREIGPGEKQTFTVSIVEEDVSFTFREPRQVFFNEVEVVESEVICGDGIKNAREFCDGNDLGRMTCQSLGFNGGTLACTASCALDTSACGTEPNPGGCGDGIRNGAEQCDLADLGGQTCQSQGFDGGTLTCSSSCSLDTAACTQTQCGNGIRNGGEECDGSSLGGASCSGGTVSCREDCTLDFSACPSCGDGIRNGPEACEGTDLGNMTCQSLGFSGGILSCNAGCGFDTSACTTCGDGTAEGAEDCDGSDLQGESCQSLGFDGGTLSCTAGCGFNTSACTTIMCGDGIAEGNEMCDGSDLQGESCQSLGFDGGTLSCTAGCGFNTSGCTNNVCGDGIVGGNEMCDGSDLQGESCQSLGFDGGMLSCTAGCGFNTSACTNNVCGDGIVGGNEMCDGSDLQGESCQSLGFNGGTLSCTAGCGFNTSACTN